MEVVRTEETLRERMVRRGQMLRFVLDHPLNRNHRLRAMGRVAAWQAWRHVLGRPLTVRFWDGLRVRVYPDWPYSWTALYVRLTEYDEMTFALRYLAPGDGFIDVGANIGLYSLLASRASRGAPVVAIEPHPLAAARLRENADLNSFANIDVRQAAAGSAGGVAMLTSGLVDQNQIRPELKGYADSVRAPVVTIDDTLPTTRLDPGAVSMVKIDTEGFEARVLAGARGLLSAEPGPVWLVELAGLGRRYRSGDTEVRTVFHDHGYVPLGYDATANRLTSRESGFERGNVIYARDPDAVSDRLNTAS